MPCPTTHPRGPVERRRGLRLTCRPETAAREVEFGRGQPPGQATDQSCASNNWNGRRRRVASDYERQATIRPASNTCSYDRHPLIVKASHARSTRFASPGIHLTAVPRVGSGRCRSVVAVLRNNEAVPRALHSSDERGPALPAGPPQLPARSARGRHPKGRSVVSMCQVRRIDGRTRPPRWSIRTFGHGRRRRRLRTMVGRWGRSRRHLR